MKTKKINRLILVFLVLLLVSNFQIQSQTISIQAGEISLKQAFEKIEAYSQYKIAYNDTQLDVSQKVNLNIKNKDATQVFKDLLKDTGYSFKINGNYVVVVPEQLKNKKQESDKTEKVTGIVKDENGEPVIGASVVVKGTSNGTITDLEGKFSIEIPENAILQISYLGYNSQDVPMRGKKTVSIKLIEDTKALDEVVVVGYGTQRKINVTGAIQSISAKDMEGLPVAQISQQLQGKLSGVQILQGSGKPGEGMSMRIRGQASISAQGQPLYVVDGFPVEGDISYMNPNEIESITILKDASSTSLYGSRASFGVVLLETKRAKAGQTSLNLNSYYGIQKVPQKGRPDMMNAQEFALFKKESYEFNNKPVPELYQKPEQYGRGTDWYDVLLRDAPIQDYNLSLTAGKDNFSTSATLGYFDQQGVVINSGFQRYSLRINSEYKFNKKLKLKFNVAPSNSVYKGPNTDGSLWGAAILMNAILSSPLAVHKNADGSMPLTSSSEGLFPNPNWYRVAKEVDATRNNFKLLSNASVEYEVINDLLIKTSLNIDFVDNRNFRFSPSTTGNIGAPPPQKATAQEDNFRHNTWLNENIATYKKKISGHEFDMLLGFTAQKFRSDWSSIHKTDFPDDRIHTLSAGATTNQAESSIQEWSMLSVLGRVNYNFLNKYIVSGAIRRDGSSRFGTNNKWGNFPSISVGWVASEEDFMQSFKNFPFLKIRASYGLTGNNNIGNYPYYAAVNTANYSFDNSLANGRAVGSLSNLFLGWEKTNQLDLGIDVGFLNNRLSLTYDYYKKKTDGLLFATPIPIQSGFGSLTDNIGTFNFWGHEISLSTRNFVEKNFQWNTDFNISFNDNKVMKLGTSDAPVYSGVTITRVGDRIGQFWGFQVEGIYQNAQDLANSPKYASSDVGTIKMKDVNKNGIITNTNDDKTIIGNPLPTFIYGLTNNLSCKKMNLSIVIAGSVGNDVSNLTKEFTENLDGAFNVTRNLANRWKSEQEPGNGKIPSVKTGTTDLARFYNSSFVSNASFLTVKNITLGYNIPLKSTAFFRNINVYGSIQNAFVFTNYEGANPEVSNDANNALNQGIDESAYPIPRTFIVGLNIGF
ncbi:SusC/RagA family TonB-linked outer membrane protein [Bacteroidales bacterium]|nr:SusC/RagA family TonB-linked outer membrane protein [Bacteroidales bacterium]